MPSQEYPDVWVFQSFAGAHLIAIDLAAAPPTFNVTAESWAYTYDVAARATKDSCASCGLCADPEKDCPYVGAAFPDNPPDFCTAVTRGEGHSVGDGPLDGNGPFTCYAWSFAWDSSAAPTLD